MGSNGLNIKLYDINNNLIKGDELDKTNWLSSKVTQEIVNKEEGIINIKVQDKKGGMPGLVTYNNCLGNIRLNIIEKVIQEEKPVFNEKLTYKKHNTYKDGCVLTVDKNYMVPALESGVVVFLGEKEDYGTTIIIEQIDGIEVFYSNVDAINLKLYDYVEKGKLIGEVKKDKLYLVFSKDGKYLDYQKYI